MTTTDLPTPADNRPLDRTYRMPADTLRQLEQLAVVYFGNNRSMALRAAIQAYWFARRPDLHKEVTYAPDDS